MGQLLLHLVPEMLGLLVTPAAVIGAVLLLQSSRPVANTVAFGAGFLVQYTVLAAAALVGGAARGGNPIPADVKGWIGAALGALFLAGAAFQLLRRPAPATVARPPRWLTELAGAGPQRAFVAGVVLSIVNPNVAILLSGMSVIAAADVPTGTAIGGTLALLVASSLDVALPVGAYLLLGRRADRGLATLRDRLIRHDRAIGITVLLVFGIGFLARGLATVAG